MIKRRLYLQLVFVLAGSLFVFASVAAVLWRTTGHDEYEGELFQKTSTLAMLLLPPADADLAVQVEAIHRIGNSLDLDLTMWSPDGELLAVRGQAASLPGDLPSVNQWQPSKGQTQWTTRLPDNRVLVINLHRLAVPSDAVGFVSTLFLLASFIAAVSYQFIRRITKRLEELQKQVLQIGAGDFSARVSAKGDDEVAALAAAFNRSAEQIEGLMTAQRLLLANASHELRTPLARIRLGIELLQTRYDEARREALQADIRELDELIDELILMTRLDTGLQTEDACENVDLTALAAEECIRYQNCELNGTAEAEVSGDRRMLQHLLRNLIDNGFAHGKAPVTVEVRKVRQVTYLTVADEGDGIPTAEQEMVFQPFYRANGKQNVPGYGLGLPLVERIASYHGAFVAIENRPISKVSVVFGADRKRHDLA
ncbi:MAG: HAMP domain-containing sensor histidine kinase [Pseudomonadota bacterium]